MAEVTTAEAGGAGSQERLSHEMGMHTEQLRGRTQQKFFEFNLADERASFSLPTPSTSISTSAPRSTPRTCRSAMSTSGFAS